MDSRLTIRAVSQIKDANNGASFKQHISLSPHVLSTVTHTMTIGKWRIDFQLYQRSSNSQAKSCVLLCYLIPLCVDSLNLVRSQNSFNYTDSGLLKYPKLQYFFSSSIISPLILKCLDPEWYDCSQCRVLLSRPQRALLSIPGQSKSSLRGPIRPCYHGSHPSKPLTTPPFSPVEWSRPAPKIHPEWTIIRHCHLACFLFPSISTQQFQRQPVLV